MDTVSAKHKALVEKKLNGMTLEQKVGQLLCLGFCGTYPYPDIVDMIRKYHVAGFRITPYARKFGRYFKDGHPGTKRINRPPEPHERLVGAGAPPTRLNAREYAGVLNHLRKISMESGAGIPLYYSLDYEGNGSSDFLAPNMFGVPHPMGLAAARDPKLTRAAARLVGTQLKAVGIDWVHSPDVDVNTDPRNPEIGTRAFSPHARICAEGGLQTYLGYRDALLVATGKHFPGRGHSSCDAHYEVPLIKESARRMREVHLAAYRPMIAAGLPAIMLAHSVYPHLDPSGEISTLSRRIVTGLLREEMGYDRVIITDSFTMGGLVARYDVDEAAVRAFEAGVDLLLLKDENALRGEVYNALLKAVRKGRLSEENITASVRRTLLVKAEYGLLDGRKGMVDPDGVNAILEHPENTRIARRASRETVLVLKKSGRFPFKKGARVAVFEEVNGHHVRHATPYMHCGMLYEALLERGVDATFVDYDAKHMETALPLMKWLAKRSDVIVFTGYYARQSGADLASYKQILKLGKPAIFVGNSPYDQLILPAMKDVIVHFNPDRFSMEMVADILTGRAKATAKLNFAVSKVY